MFCSCVLRKFLSAHTFVTPGAVSNSLSVPRLAHIYSLTAPRRGSNLVSKLSQMG